MPRKRSSPAPSPTPAEVGGLPARVARLEEARVGVASRRQLDELGVLYAVSRAVTGQLETRELVEAIPAPAGRALDTGHMVVFLYDPARREFEVALRMRDGQTDPSPDHRYPEGTGLISAVIRDGTPIRTTDYAAACRARGVLPTSTGLGFRHWLGAPMLVGQEVVGVLVLRSALRPFTEDDERLLGDIAGLVAPALRSARLHAERTAAYDELRTAQDRLVRTEKLRALGEMAAGVAHDFSNLLAVILGRAELLLRQAREPDLLRGLEAVRQAALDGAQTVRRIQGFARTRRTRSFVPVDLRQVVQEAVGLSRSRWKDDAESRGVTYDVVVEGEVVPPVAGRPEELREAFTHLLTNALESMPAGGRLVFRVRADADAVVVTATDTGCGMSGETVQRVFEPFFTTKGPRGSGLGLPLVWGTVTRHGGTIEVDSRPGEGSAFTVRIPDTGDAVADGSAPSPRPVRGARILVVDDEAGVRETLRDLLTAEGYAVIEAGDGPAGLALCETASPDLVLSDVSMPGMSGWDVAGACLARFPGLPVGLITGWADQLDAPELERHRVRLVLAKPFESAAVLARVADALAAPRS